jgi:hypothetical protein
MTFIYLKRHLRCAMKRFVAVHFKDNYGPIKFKFKMVFINLCRGACGILSLGIRCVLQTK